MGRRMTPERWLRVEELYHAALERDTFERRAFLATACASDDELRGEVESLIASNEQEGSFMDSPVFKVADELSPSEPPLAEGERLGSYQILGALGEGGMGVVYLARDMRLGRKVALKLLPPSLKKDEGRLRRLRREAQAASSLNHPNILTIYEIGEAEQGHYIASEYVEGETLRERMRAGLKLVDALDLAVQMASALAAAHSAGIIHRDIKPENAMIRRDGYVKVLDFGLAKLSEPGAVASGTEAPTRSLVRTDPGVVMGTVAYMSPEQARGQETDARTDLFSLGVVLYEMVAGHTPFDGETPSDLIATLLKDEPAPLARYAPEAPEELQRIFDRALSKDKGARYQNATEMLADLKRLKEALESEAKSYASAQADNGGAIATLALSPAARTADEQARPTGGSERAPALSSAEYIVSEIRRHKAGAVLALLALFVTTTALGFVAYRFLGQAKRSAAPANITLTRITTSGKAGSAAVSPDGRYVAYVTYEAGQQSLWIRQVATNSNVQIVPPAPSSYWGLTFSRDGNYLYYFGQTKDDTEPALYQMPALGGVARKLLEGTINTSGSGPVALSPDGQRLALVRDYSSDESALVIANADGTAERKLASRTGNAFFTSASWSPDGRKIAVVGGGSDARGAPYSDMIEVEVDGGAQRPLKVEGWGWISDVAWLSDGSGLLITAAVKGEESSQVWQIPYPEGPPRKITTDLNGYFGLSLTADCTALVSTRNDQVMNLWVQPAGDPARATQVTTGAATRDGYSGVAWTPDGRIVYTSQASGQQDIWVMDADGGNQKQLTVGLGSGNFGLSVSPDGRYIVFVSWRAGRANIWRVNIDGSNPKQLTDGDGEMNPTVWPDGQWVRYISFVEGQPSQWRVPIDGGTPERLNTPSPTVPDISPDGKLLAYVPQGAEAGRKRLAVAPVEGGEAIKVFDLTLGLAPGAQAQRARWTPDGRALTYIVHRGGASNIWKQPLDGGPPQQLTDFKSQGIHCFAWSRDGKYLTVARGTTTNDIILMKDFR